MRRLGAWGYRVRYSDGAWCECLLSLEPSGQGSGAAELWIGRGDDRAAALADAVGRAFPSHAARQALRARLGELGEFAEPAIDAQPHAAPPAEPSVAAPAVRVHPMPVVDRATLVSPPPPDPLEEAEALERLAELRADVEAARTEVAQWSPERQRLAILSWIAAARSIEESARGARSVTGRTTEFAGLLSELTNLWWPGTVQPLFRDRTPSDCHVDLELPRSTPLHHWQDVSDAAEERLAVLERREDAAGGGDVGWADDAELLPAPPDPQALFGEVEHDLLPYGGSLGLKHERADHVRLRTLDDEVVERLRRTAEQLRWLRGSVADGWRWGLAIGRMRWVASGLPRKSRGRLDTVLASSFRPQGSWAEALGHDSGKRERQRRKRRLLRTRPRPEDAPGKEQVLGWTLHAFDCEDLSAERVAAILRPFAEVVSELDPEAFEERKVRKRLRKLQGQLSEPAGPEIDDVELREADREPPEPDPAPATPSFSDQLLASVLPRTRGARVLLVTNRADPDQDRVLAETFQFAELEHGVHDLRKVQALTKRIEAGRYDLVLSATGFQPHKVDTLLRDACRARSTPYVRVNRARRTACIRALARELGHVQSA